MNEARYYHAGAHHPDLGFLITGGLDSGYKSTTEISRDGITFEYYTPLPIGLFGHCMVALDNDDGEFFIGGGFSSGVSNKAFIHKGNQWVEVEHIKWPMKERNPVAVANFLVVSVSKTRN